MSRNKIFHGSRLAVSASVFATMASAASIYTPTATAQEEAPDDGVRRLESVTVVAQKREEDILSVPVAVSAISAETLETSGIADFADLTRVAPSLTIATGTNANNSSVNLRGIGTFAFSIGVEPSVSVVVDDVAVVQQAQAFSALNDIERVEVLRGPQGTLFGKNASAGVVNIVTKGPTSTLTASLDATITDDDEQRYSASIAGPIGDSAGFRINANLYDREGHIKNTFTGKNLDGEEGSGIRAKFEWGPTENLQLQLIGEHTERTTTGVAQTYRAVPATARLFGAIPVALTLANLAPGEDNFSVHLDGNPFSNNTQDSVSLKISYNLGEFNLVSVSSYQDWEFSFDQDVDGTAFDVIGALTRGAAQGGVNQSSPFAATQFSQELRLFSPRYEKFNYLIGLFYSDSETSRSFTRGPVVLRAEWDAETTSTSYAAFGQGTVQLSDKWDLSGGVRINKEEISATFDNRLDALGAFKGSDSESAVTGKIALQYFATDDISIFGSVSTGYKGKGYDISTGFNQNRADNPVGSETAVSYEIGLKSRLFDNRMQLNATAFLTDYEDFQAQSAVIDPITFTTNFVLNNVGELRTQGIEIDAVGQITNNLRLDASIAMIDATIESFVGAQCYPGQTAAAGCVGGVQDLSGKELANSPDLKYTVGATYERDLSNLPFGLFANLNYQWQDDVNFDLFLSPLRTQDAYGLLNASIGIVESRRGAYKLTFFGQNLTDQRYVSGLADARNIYGGAPVLLQIQPRNARTFYGVRLKVQL